MLSGSVLNAASFKRSSDAIVPGQIISIFGDSLAASAASAKGSPVSQLAGIQVHLGDTVIPLFYAGPRQINGVIPFSVPVGQRAQLTVERNGVPSVPLSMVTTAAQPGIFTVAQNGSGQGAILLTSGKLADASSPARRGDIVSIYCTGLGPVDAAIDVTAPAPSNPLARVKGRTTVSVGNLSAQVDFAGLAPGFSGLYQVNFRVPPGAPVGSAVPIILTVEGADSNTVTMAIQ